MLNINYGRNKRLLDACRPLAEYSWFVAEVRKNCNTVEIETAINRVISDMPSDFILKPFLEAHRAEVLGMMLMEYNEAEQMNLFREDGRREGRQEGRQEGTLSTLIDLVKDNLLSVTNAAKKAGVSEEDFEKMMSAEK